MPSRSHESIVGTKPIVAVTGASRGIGHAIVKHYFDNGWEVITLARSAISDQCPWADGKIRHIEVDLLETGAILRAATELRQLLGDRGLDALVNNAGISPKCADGGRMGALNTTIETLAAVHQINLYAPILLCQELMGPLIMAKGAIVNISSIAAHRVHPFAGAAYAISKAGLSTFTRELAHEIGDRGVRVNAIAPGEISTSILSAGTDEIVQSRVPMKRIGNPEEVAEVVYFLTTSHSSFVTGTEIHINGGQHI